MLACRVKVMATSEDESVHIVQAGNPGRLLRVIEDGPTMDLTWRFIRTRDITGIDLLLSPMSFARRCQIVRKVTWLMGQITGQRALRKVRKG